MDKHKKQRSLLCQSPPCLCPLFSDCATSIHIIFKRFCTAVIDIPSDRRQIQLIRNHLPVKCITTVTYTPRAGLQSPRTQMAHRTHPMPLAFHNTAFGRACSSQSSSTTAFDTTRIMSPISHAFRYVQPARNERPVQVRGSGPQHGSMADLQRRQATVVRASSAHYAPPSQQEIRKYQALPLPPTPTNSVKSVMEPCSIRQSTQYTLPLTSLAFGRQTYVDRPLPPTPGSRISAIEML